MDLVKGRIKFNSGCPQFSIIMICGVFAIFGERGLSNSLALQIIVSTFF
jgi:hypothetical protein